MIPQKLLLFKTPPSLLNIKREPNLKLEEMNKQTLLATGKL